MGNGLGVGDDNHHHQAEVEREHAVQTKILLRGCLWWWEIYRLASDMSEINFERIRRDSRTMAYVELIRIIAIIDV